MTEDPVSTASRLVRDGLAKLEKFGNDQSRALLRKPKTIQTVQGVVAAGLALQQARLDAIAKVLAANEMPSRSELMAVAERIGAMEASLARIETALATSPSPPRPQTRPSRARKPASQS